MNYGQVKRLFEASLNNMVAGDIATTDEYLYMGMARIQRELRLPFMIGVNVTIAGEDFGYVAKPNDYINFKHLMVNNKELTRVGYSRFFQLDRCTHEPAFYLPMQDRFLITSKVPPGSEVVLIYYREMQRPVLDTDENDITRLMPELLNYASLYEAATTLLLDDNIRELFKARYDELAAMVQQQADDEEYEGMMTMEAPAGDY